jgi:hypothetical protein
MGLVNHLRNPKQWAIARKLQKPTRFGVRVSKNHQIWENFQKTTTFHVDSSNRR